MRRKRWEESDGEKDIGRKWWGERDGKKVTGRKRRGKRKDEKVLREDDLKRGDKAKERNDRRRRKASKAQNVKTGPRVYFKSHIKERQFEGSTKITKTE